MPKASALRVERPATFAAAEVRVERPRQIDYARVDFGAIERNTKRAEREANRAIGDLLAQAIWRLLGDRERVGQLLDSDIADIGLLKIDTYDVGKLKVACRQALERGWLIGQRNARSEAMKFVRDRTAPGAEVKRLVFKDLRDTAADYFEANGFRMAQNLSDGSRAIIAQELTRAVRTGDDHAAVVARIYSRLMDRGFMDADAVESVVDDPDIAERLAEAFAGWDAESVPSYLNTLVRTNVFEAMNEARFAEFTDPELGGYVEGFEYSAIMDDRTTEFCREMDGKVYAADNEIWDSYRPPNHFNCRSLLIPITQRSGWDGVESEPPAIEPMEGFVRHCGHRHHFEFNPDQPRDADGKWGSGGGGEQVTSAAASIQAAVGEAVGESVQVNIVATNDDEARQLGSSLTGTHVYLDSISRASTAEPGSGRKALDALVAKADSLGVHVLVSAQDDGSGKLFALYEQAGFERISSDAGDGHMMLRPAKSQ